MNVVQKIIHDNRIHMTDSVLVYTLPGIAAIGIALASCACIRFLKRRKHQTSAPIYPPVQPMVFQQNSTCTSTQPVYAPNPTIPTYNFVQGPIPCIPVQPTAPMSSFYTVPSAPPVHPYTSPQPSAPPIDSAYAYAPQTHIVLNHVEPHQRIYFG